MKEYKEYDFEGTLKQKEIFLKKLSRYKCVDNLRKSGMTFAAIGKEIGVNMARAAAIFHNYQNFKKIWGDNPKIIFKINPPKKQRTKCPHCKKGWIDIPNSQL